MNDPYRAWVALCQMIALAVMLIVFAVLLSGCGMMLTLNPFGMLGIVHHRSHATAAPVCPPKDKHCIDDSGMRP